jgi:hypothetical protein
MVKITIANHLCLNTKESKDIWPKEAGFDEVFGFGWGMGLGLGMGLGVGYSVFSTFLSGCSN